MSSEYTPYIYAIFAPFAVALFGITYGLVLKGFDRKLAAHMQWRVGPPLRQPFYDILKLFEKENIIPKNAVPWLFNMAPLISLTSLIVALLYLPLGPFKPFLGNYGDLIVLLYIIALPGLAMIIGGFASSSPYSAVGAQREFIMTLSYEFPLATIVFTFAWKYSTLYPNLKSFSLLTFMEHPLWSNVGILGFIGLLILLIAMLVVTTGEIGRMPFDIAEAGTEISGGALLEYTGKNLGMFYLADGVKIIVLGSIITTFFFPYNLSSLLTTYFSLPKYAWLTIDFLFYLLKLFFVSFVVVTLMRVAYPRFRVTGAVKFYWGFAALASLIALILIALDTLGGV